VRRRSVWGSDLVAALVGIAMFGVYFGVSLYLQDVAGYSPLRAGMAYLPLSLAMVLSSAIAGRCVDRWGPRATLLASLPAVAIGLGWYAGVPHAGPDYVADILGPSLMVAAGLGLAMVAVSAAAVSGSAPQQAASAGALLTTAVQIGGALGTAVAASIITATGYRAAFVILAAVVAVTGMIAAAVVPPPARRRGRGQVGVFEPAPESASS
jgi:predicted MFS family arabinose efflux permease